MFMCKPCYVGFVISEQTNKKKINDLFNRRSDKQIKRAHAFKLLFESQKFSVFLFCSFLSPENLVSIGEIYDC